jgi:tetrahedral aminopeptidase
MALDVGNLLATLSEATGVSGYEMNVRSIVHEVFSRYADEIRSDKMGNVIALKRGSGPEPRPGIMLAAHMDEIGLIVTRIKDGFIQFVTVGGFDPRVLLGQLVVVHGHRPLPGVIASRPPHVLSPTERDKVIPIDELFIDIGLKADDVGNLVQVGDLISLEQKFVRLKGDCGSGKALDDRAGVASLVVCLEELSTRRHEWDVFAVATVQEEVGLKGAITSSYGLAPDLGIAVDVTFGHQPGVAESETFAMGKGPAIAIGPNVHPGMVAKLFETAKEHEISYVPEPIPGRSGTDAWAIQVAREGVPTCLLGIPIRYMHTVVETVNLRDITRTGRLMAAFISRLDRNTLGEIAWKLPGTQKEEVN